MNYYYKDRLEHNISCQFFFKVASIKKDGVKQTSQWICGLSLNWYSFTEMVIEEALHNNDSVSVVG